MVTDQAADLASARPRPARPAAQPRCLRRQPTPFGLCSRQEFRAAVEPGQDPGFSDLPGERLEAYDDDDPFFSADARSRPASDYGGLATTGITEQHHAAPAIERIECGLSCLPGSPVALKAKGGRAIDVFELFDRRHPHARDEVCDVEVCWVVRGKRRQHV